MLLNAICRDLEVKKNSNLKKITYICDQHTLKQINDYGSKLNEFLDFLDDNSKFMLRDSIIHVMSQFTQTISGLEKRGWYIDLNIVYVDNENFLLSLFFEVLNFGNEFIQEMHGIYPKDFVFLSAIEREIRPCLAFYFALVSALQKVGTERNVVSRKNRKEFLQEGLSLHEEVGIMLDDTEEFDVPTTEESVEENPTKEVKPKPKTKNNKPASLKKGRPAKSKK